MIENNMNRYFKTFAMAVAAAGLLASCNREDVTPEQPDLPNTPEQPAATYRLSFEGGAGIETATRASWDDPTGSGNLIFQWDYTAEGQDGNEMVMALHKEEFLASTAENYHSFVNIKPHGTYVDDAHWAIFETMEEYASPLSSGAYDGYEVVALTPLTSVNGSEVFSDDNMFNASLPMPATFVQDEDKAPAFLRDYMYMYAHDLIDGSSATLSFYHIPATLRFKITNNRPGTTRINSVKVTVVDADGNEYPVASQSVWFEVNANHSPELKYSEASYTELAASINADLAPGGKYTAYALAFPLADDNAFKDKQLRFTISAQNPDNEYLSFVLDGAKIAGANNLYDDDLYNWVGGKSYTINVGLNDAVTGLVLDKDVLELNYAESYTLTATVTPDDAYSKSVIWSTADESIARVNDGKVTGVGSGTTTITATTPNGELSATCTVTVIMPVESVTIALPADKATIKVGETLSLSDFTTVNPDNATYKHLTWSSSNNKVATVTSDGVVTALAGGTTTITATSVNGKTATCSIIVQVPVDGGLGDGGDMGGGGDVNVGW